MKNYPVFGSFRTESGGSVTVDTELSSVSENPVQNKAIAAAITNPNLLINPDFKINQRGLTEYTEDHEYGIDRWICEFHGDGNTGSYNANTNTLSCTVTERAGYYSNLHQYIEKPSRLAGKTVTFSAKFKSTENNCLIQVWRRTGSAISAVAASPTNKELNKVLTVVIPEDITDEEGLILVVQTRGTSVLDWAKFEVGSIATPFVPPDPATELVKCQRYYQRICEKQGAFYGSGYVGSTGRYVLIYMPYITEMRITSPTITVSGTVYIAVNEKRIPLTDIAPTRSSYCTALQSNIETDTTIANQPCLLQNRDNTSYIELSAEL